ncbi:MAG: hypothetical protein M9930_22135, partial [Anaerolineae bacterium]|nr:hypothetical protein [Anaerolineae bacterium]
YDVSADEEQFFPIWLFAGDTVTFFVYSEDGFDALVEVQDFDGNVLLSADESFTEENVEFTAETDDIYYFVVRSFDENPGSYDVLITAPASAIPDVAVGDLVNGKIEEDGYLEFGYLGDAGERFAVEVIPEQALDVIVQILDFDNNVLAEVDDQFNGETEYLEFELPENSTYFIRIFGYDGAGGDFVMNVLSLDE